MLQPEALVLIQDYTRRLKTALQGAPNHLRVEAALEVESHVRDTLSRGTGEGSQTEQVLQILRGFGSPEEYAAALLSQAGVEAATVKTGAKRVWIALRDLFSGFGALIMAFGRQVGRLVVTVAQRVASGVRWSTRTARRAVPHVAAPVARGGRWLGGRVKAVGVQARKLRNVARLVSAAGQAMLRAVRWLIALAAKALLLALALTAFAVAAFAALAPDIVGYVWYLLDHEVTRFLAGIRESAMSGLDPAMFVTLESTGVIAQQWALGIGFAALTVLVLVIWSPWRRRGDLH